MTAYTKGPWVIADSDPGAPDDALCVGTPSRVDPDHKLNEVVAEVWPVASPFSDPRANRDANAALIAAAPELLEALTAVCDHYIDVNAPFEDDEERRVVALADEALAKAEGKARGMESSALRADSPTLAITEVDSDADVLHNLKLAFRDGADEVVVRHDGVTFLLTPRRTP